MDCRGLRNKRSDVVVWPGNGTGRRADYDEGVGEC